ncbi:hypothetical protein GGI12_001836 [Dipsacomyces acuminosporus]|nr:hypothetical protein GGI12_001836 [Dipsacomyces acuminosporus]
MKHSLWFSVLALSLWTSSTLGEELIDLRKRLVQISRVSEFRGALLVANKQQTTCDIALLDNRSGYIAASCFKLKGNKVDYSQKYEVYVDNGRNMAPSSFKVDGVAIHPSFNATTFANNIAVIKFNQAEKSLWKSYLAGYRPEWDDLYYARRTLADIKDMEWNTPAAYAQFKDSDGCADASELYRNNLNGTMCITASTPSIYNKDCRIPYGSVYGIMQPGDMAIAALYSHSVVYGKDMCGDSRQFHYYTVIANYISWGAELNSLSISVFVRSKTTWTSYKNFVMNETQTPGNPDTTIFSGNLYPREGAIEPSEASSSSPTPSSSSSPSATPPGASGVPSASSTSSATSSNAPHSSSSDSTSGGITRTAIIAISVAVPISTILGIVVLFFVYKWWRKRQNELTWNATQERSNFNAIQIMNEIGGTTGSDKDLPSYEALLAEGRQRPTSAPRL